MDVLLTDKWMLPVFFPESNQEVVQSRLMQEEEENIEDKALNP